MRFRPLALLVPLLLLSGCSRGREAKSPAPSQPSASAAASSPGAPSRSVAPAPPTPTASAAASAGCEPARSATPGRIDATVELKGAPARDYVLYLPDDYDGTTPVPLVFNLHGHGSDADQQLLYSGMTGRAADHGFALVALNGQGRPRHFNQHPERVRGEVSDIDVVTTVLKTLTASLCIDQKRVYAMGMSDGGVLAAALGCFASDRFAAVATVAALVYDPGCAKAAPVPIMVFRGTDDPIVPYEGGRVACCGNPVVKSTADDIRSWAKHNGCAAKPRVARKAAVETSAYAGCKADVVLHTIVGGGHTWPGAFGLPGLGDTNRDINASDAIWEFFVAQSKR